MNLLRSTRQCRPAALLLALVLAVLGAVLLKGCTATVLPPAHVRDPVSIYILDYGRHPGIVLRRSDAELVEYSYGEWEWFALNRTGWFDVVRALLINSPGTLGRRTFDDPPHQDWWLEVPLASLHELRVERADAEALLAHLDERWEANRDSAVYNAARDLDFVADAAPYSVWNNSNIVLARWLEIAGCEVRGWAIYPVAWRVVQPE